MTKVKTVWTDDLLAAVKHAWEKTSDSASVIGVKFGLTKGQVIGKAYRKGWVKKAGKVGRPRTRKPRPPKAKPLPPPEPVVVPEPRFGQTDLLNLHSMSCRWPYDGGWYCGKEKVRGAYCEEHAARAYVRPGNYRPRTVAARSNQP